MVQRREIFCMKFEQVLYKLDVRKLEKKLSMNTDFLSEFQ